ncbi:MAG: glycosyltransferase [Candidatus Cloacimonetes bacterium]|nr:glycosyltransferase [Candidatus Cloacimonadota bacterium]
MKKILILSVSHFWYDSRLFFRVIKSLLKKNNVSESVQVYIKLMTQNSKDNLQIEVENFEKVFISSKLNRFAVLKSFIKEGLSYQPDIVICIEPLTLIAGHILKKRTQCRFIYDSHEYFAMAFEEKYKYTYSLYWQVEKYFAKKTDAIITVNKELVQHLSNANPNTHLCANYPVKDLFLKNTGETIKKEYDLIYAGGICFERGLLQYLQAARYLKADNIVFTFAIVGVFFEKSTKDFFDNYLKQYHLENSVIYIPYIPIEQVLLEIRKSKIGIFMGDITKRPRLDKTLNMKIFEYLSQGIPVIVNDSTVLKDFVNQTNSGWVIPYSSKELYKLMKQIINKEFDLELIGNEAKQLVYDKYVWENQEEVLYNAVFGMKK